MACQRRRPWSTAEDGRLLQLVQTYGPSNWPRISQALGSRTPKQCRERYHQKLKPSLNHDPITPKEGLQIKRLVDKLGKRWAEIARRLYGRSDNAIKNWWNASQNRRKRLDRRRTVGGMPPYEIDHYHASPPSPSPPAARRHQLPWADATLSSPWASELPECKPSVSNYTISPAGRLSPPTQMVELPPLREWSRASSSSESNLPSLSSLASWLRVDGAHMPSPRPQLSTAPNSPVQHPDGKEKDSRMTLSALLG